MQSKLRAYWGIGFLGILLLSGVNVAQAQLESNDCAALFARITHELAPRLTYQEVQAKLAQNFGQAQDLAYFQRASAEIQQAGADATRPEYWLNLFTTEFRKSSSVEELNKAWANEQTLRSNYSSAANAPLRDFWGKAFSEAITVRHLAWYEAYIKQLAAHLKNMEAGFALAKFTAPNGEKYFGLQKILTPDNVGDTPWAEQPGMGAMKFLQDMVQDFWHEKAMSSDVKLYVYYYDPTIGEILAKGDIATANTPLDSWEAEAIFPKDVGRNATGLRIPRLAFSQEVSTQIALSHEHYHYVSFHLWPKLKIAPENPRSFPGGSKNLTLSEILAYAKEYDTWKAFRTLNQQAYANHVPGAINDARWLQAYGYILVSWRQVMDLLIPTLENELNELRVALAFPQAGSITWREEPIGPLVQKIIGTTENTRLTVEFAYTMPKSGEKRTFVHAIYDLPQFQQEVAAAGEADLNAAWAKVLAQRLGEEVAVDLVQIAKLKERKAEADLLR